MKTSKEIKPSKKVINDVEIILTDIWKKTNGKIYKGALNSKELGVNQRFLENVRKVLVNKNIVFMGGSKRYPTYEWSNVKSPYNLSMVDAISKIIAKMNYDQNAYYRSQRKTSPKLEKTEKTNELIKIQVKDRTFEEILKELKDKAKQLGMSRVIIEL